MAYMFCTAACFGCGCLFTFNPELVPSISVNAVGQPDPAGHREPVCRNCIERANPRRIANGLEPIYAPAGAYEPQEVP